MKSKLLKFVPSAFIAFVFIQSLFFKFTGSYETEFIFGTLGEWSGLAWFGSVGGYLIGFAELIAAFMLFSRFHGLGALMSVGIMTGAIFFHLFTPLGIVMPEFNSAGEVIGNDGGLLFTMACIVWTCGAFLTIRDLRSEQSTLKLLLNR
ncbi:hypothetical protein [Vibrio sp. SCSIO 43137]|uniref:hypothetical protein n=1 Tax=Vibrio sp. SCSIO 43137 TaxID=3021011 RepID=UPI00230711C1|nr:hypothetical protein [Vibrio sp. SCSIO 43137]WCE30971.1 hypothetical protein PK654_06815 [Vibrio sp. SCSIO 43137]